MRVLFHLLCLFLLVYACAPAYRPTVLHTPLYTEHGDYSGSAHTGVNSFDGHVGGAITDNIGFMVSGSYTDRELGPDSYRLNNHLEFSPGAFYSPDENFVLEAYGGYGFGWIESQGSFTLGNSTSIRTVSGNYSKLFIQPGIGVTSEVVDAGLHLRFSSVYFPDLRTSQGNELFFRGRNNFIEPVLTFRLGYQYIKFNIQAGLSLPTNELAYEYNPFILSIGAVIDIRKRYYNQND